MSIDLRLRFVPMRHVGASVVLVPERQLALVDAGMSYEVALAAVANMAASHGVRAGVLDVPAEVFAVRARETALGMLDGHLVCLA